MFLREADRMLMLIEEGVALEVSANHAEKAVRFIDRFYEERELYREAFPDQEDVYGFLEGTLFRTQTGLAIFKRLKQEVYEKFGVPVGQQRSEVRDKKEQLHQKIRKVAAEPVPPQNHLIEWAPVATFDELAHKIKHVAQPFHLRDGEIGRAHV